MERNRLTWRTTTARRPTDRRVRLGAGPDNVQAGASSASMLTGLARPIFPMHTRQHLYDRTGGANWRKLRQQYVRSWKPEGYVDTDGLASLSVVQACNQTGSRYLHLAPRQDVHDQHPTAEAHRARLVSVARRLPRRLDRSRREIEPRQYGRYQA